MPTSEEIQRFTKIRIRGARGDRLYREEIKFLEMVYFKKYRKWWEANKDRINAEIREATKPFGAV